MKSLPYALSFGAILYLVAVGTVAAETDDPMVEIVSSPLAMLAFGMGCAGGWGFYDRTQGAMYRKRDAERDRDVKELKEQVSALKSDLEDYRELARGALEQRLETSVNG